jgi:H+-translocating NAD(P) transhydrogenase subunit beta
MESRRLKPLWLFLLLAVLGAMIGSISFSGSIIAFAKLQEYQSFRNPLRFIGQQKVNAILFGLMFLLGLIIALSGGGQPGAAGDVLPAGPGAGHT